MGVSKSQTSKTQTSDPLGVSKTQTLQVSRKLSPLRYKKFRQRVPNNAASRLVYCSSITESAEKRKRLAVEETYTDHENNIQRVSESTGAKFSCVTVSQPANVCPASDTGYSLQVYPYGSLWFDALSWFEFCRQSTNNSQTEDWLLHGEFAYLMTKETTFKILHALHVRFSFSCISLT